MSTLHPDPAKRRNTVHWKAVAKNAQLALADRQREIDRLDQELEGAIAVGVERANRQHRLLALLEAAELRATGWRAACLGVAGVLLLTVGWMVLA